MKKAIAILLALVLVLALAACGGTGAGNETPANNTQTNTNTNTNTQTNTNTGNNGGGSSETTGPVSITLWTYPIGNWQYSETVDSLLADFNAVYPDITVTVEYLDYTNGDDQINTAIEGGRAPDLVMEGPERLVSNWGARGLMVDLSDLYTSDMAQGITDSVVAACTGSDGKIYEYPLCMTAHCMAINYDIFDAAGALQYLDESTYTWKSSEDFLKAVQAVYDNGQQFVGALYCNGQGGDQGTRALINNLYGGKFMNNDYTAYALESAENVKAVETLVAQDGINIDSAINASDEINNFRNGTFAMSFCWNAAQQNNTANGPAGTTNDGSRILPMQFPVENGGTANLQTGIWGFGIFDNGDAAKIAAAKTFITYMCEENALNAIKETGFLSANGKIMTSDVYAGTDIADTMAIFDEYFLPYGGEYYQGRLNWTTARYEWWNALQRIGAGGNAATEFATFDANATAG